MRVGAIIFAKTVSRTSAETDRAAIRKSPLESPGPNLCKRNHDMLATGFYFQTSVKKGKAYTHRCCRLCRIEDVQRCKARKRNPMKRAA